MRALQSIKSFQLAGCCAAATAMGLLVSTAAMAHPVGHDQSKKLFGPRDTVKLESWQPYGAMSAPQAMQMQVMPPQFATAQSEFVVPAPPSPVQYVPVYVPYYAQPYAPYYGPQYGAYFAPQPPQQYTPRPAPQPMAMPYYSQPVYPSPYMR